MNNLSAEGEIVIERVFDAPRAAAEREMCRQGWSESLDRLAGYLATA